MILNQYKQLRLSKNFYNKKGILIDVIARKNWYSKDKPQIEVGTRRTSRLIDFTSVKDMFVFYYFVCQDGVDLL